MRLVKSIEMEDFKEFQEEQIEIVETGNLITKAGARCDIGHNMRFWEYGRAIMALRYVYGDAIAGLNVMDVGAGWSPLGPTLAYRYLVNVTEAEPDYNAYAPRVIVNELISKRSAPLNWVHTGFPNLPLGPFDAVFCVSVLEHVSKDLEGQAWIDLANRVKSDGLLYITVDCMQDNTKPHVFDNLRVTSYTTEMIKERVELLEQEGFISIGKPDWVWHGDFVHDYSFFGVGMIKRYAK